MKYNFGLPQILLRAAIGIGFIFQIIHRMRCAGRNIDSLPNCDGLLFYEKSLKPFLSKPMANTTEYVVMIAELVFGILLLIGYQIRLTAIGSCILTLIAGLLMTVYSGWNLPLNYSVFTVSMACLLLSTVPVYTWSLDIYIFRSKAEK